MKKNTTITALILAVVLVMQAAPAFAFENVKKGDQNSDVKVLQMRLNDLGYSVGTADGDFGGKTYDAISSFQQDHGLAVTGEVDETTWNALYDESVPFTQEGVSIDVFLSPPYLEINAGTDTVVLKVFGTECLVNIFNFGSDTSSVLSEIETFYHQSYEDKAVPNYQASNLNSDISYFDIDGRSAGIYTQTFDFINGSSNLRNYIYWAVMEIERENSEPLSVVAQCQTIISQGEESLVSAERIMDILRRIRVKDTSGSEEQSSAASTEQKEITTDDLFRASTMIPMYNDYIRSAMGFQDYELVPYENIFSELEYQTAVYSNGSQDTAIGYLLSFYGLKAGEEDTVSKRVFIRISIGDKGYFVDALTVLGQALENIAQEEGLQEWVQTVVLEIAEKYGTEEEITSVFEGKHIKLRLELTESIGGTDILISMTPVSGSE